MCKERIRNIDCKDRKVKVVVVFKILAALIRSEARLTGFSVCRVREGADKGEE